MIFTMTKKVLTIVFLCFFNQAFSQDLETIKSILINRESDIYESNIESYKKSEFWGIWTMPIGIPFSTSELKQQGQINYSINNLNDYDLNTAWAPDKQNNGIGEKFGFTFKFPENTEYGGAYQFFGKINLFNGYCKSLNTWSRNSRIKRLKAYYNDKPFCIIELIDSWHFQYFDIGKFFRYKRENQHMNALYEIKEGDRLTFEILDVYPGTKFHDVAISEFMAEGASN
jgi:hypothetical protein